MLPFSVKPEPVIYLGDQAVHDALSADLNAYLNYLERRLRELDRSVVENPLKQIFEDGPGLGDFRLMPCVVRDGSRVFKTVKLVGTNLVRSTVPRITVGKAMVLDPVENFVTHVVDAYVLSTMRTAALAMLAMRHFGRCGGVLRIFGAGSVGYYAAWMANQLRCFDTVEVFDPNVSALSALGNSLGDNITLLNTSAPAHLPDAIITATTSTTPFLSRAENVVLVVALGADSRFQRELHADWCSAGTVLWTENADTAELGDLEAWHRAGFHPVTRSFEPSIPLNEQLSQPTVFFSTGSALMDNLTLDYLLGESSIRDTKSSNL